ncbi:MAG: sigma-54-dependent Fis family transcriptional regulator [Nitrospina sp.]|nr:sigma-54-dependent Fis family transcriptional regulator [Nitrospina sp.]
MALIFTVDDDPGVGGLIKVLFEDRGHEVLVFENGKQCLDRLDENPSVVFLDMVMPVMDGMETLKTIKNAKNDLPVIMVTGVDDAGSAVEAMKLGAFDYIVKPFDEPRLFSVLDKAIEQTALIGQVRYLQVELNRAKGVGGIVGTSPALTATLEKILKVGVSNAGVLLLGESGTGKDLMARAIHENSHFSQGLFVDINCGAIPENLQESELFGHTKGSFTGATETRKGKLELADGGTLFLDEVAEMSLNTQVKLLRYLQEKSFERVGGTKKIFTKTRVIAATNKDLDEMVKKGSFREDLYYRLAVFPITIPPLRERKDDISSLAIHFVTLYKKEFDKKISSITPEAMNALENYFWPGNVRELGNVIYQAMIMTGTNFIDIDSLPVNVKNKNTQKTSEAVVSQYASSKGDFVEPFDTSVRQVLQRALDLTNGDIPKTAKRLKLSRSSFYRMVQKYDLTKPFSKN